jgi:hypothetical protein
MPMTDAMDVIRTRRQGRCLNILDKYHIYGISRNNSHKNDTYINTTAYFRTYTSFTTDKAKDIHPTSQNIHRRGHVSS